VVREALTPAKLDSLEPREAAAMLVARQSEGLNESEQQLLAQWLARDPSHRAMFDSAERAWRVFADSDDNEVLAAMRTHALAPRPRVSRPWLPLAAAASVLVMVAGAALYFMRSAPSATTFQYTSARGEVKEHRLPDGSRMTLDADSAASGVFGDDSRTVELQRGRALFAVETDASRPFAVVAAGHRIVAVGTRFDVNLAADGLTVTLLEGQVDVSAADSGLALATLKPGQQYTERSGDAAVRTVGAAGENAVAWRNGLINFDDQTLAEATAVMNRYSREQIVIRDPGVAGLRLSGQFRAGDSGRFAETLSEMHRLRSVRRGDEIELLPRE
jgi:transmembrane sensor